MIYDNILANDIKCLIANFLVIDSETIFDNSNLLQVASDSLELLELVIEIEEKYNLNIPSPGKIPTFKDLVMFVQQHRGDI